MIKKNDDGSKSLSVKTSKELNRKIHSLRERDNIVNLIFIFMKFWLKMIRTGVPLF